MIDDINSAIMGAFQESVTIDGTAANAIVDLRSGGRDIGAGMIVDKIDPSITLLTSDFNALTIEKNMPVVARGKQYRVMDILPDNEGITEILLRPVL